ncbi:MAG: hypothetical protein OHK0048_16840 [Rhodoferax sp.]
MAVGRAACCKRQTAGKPAEPCRAPQKPTPHQSLPRGPAPLRLAEQMGARSGIGGLLQRTLPPPRQARRRPDPAHAATMSPILLWLRADLLLHDKPALSVVGRFGLSPPRVCVP